MALASQYYPLLLLPVVSISNLFRCQRHDVDFCVAAFAVYLSLVSGWTAATLRALIRRESAPEAIHRFGDSGRCAGRVAALIVNLTLVKPRPRTEATRYKARRRRATSRPPIRTCAKPKRPITAAFRKPPRRLCQLSAGLAHELRNPLGEHPRFRGAPRALRRRRRPNPVARELAGIISEEVDRTNSLVTRFLDFQRALWSRGARVTDIARRWSTRPQDTPTGRDHPATTPPKCRRCPSHDPSLILEQVFINLLSNAAQASTPQRTDYRVHPRLLRDEAEICVVDRGCGITPDKIETIFNPFVTTKQSGVGLGLAIVAKIVDGHRGRMSVESEHGKGSTFRLFLPLETPVTKMKKRVLIVEDEDKLRRILELQLLDSGFEVEKASKAEEALPLIDRSDLILTDFKLPGMRAALRCCS